MTFFSQAVEKRVKKFEQGSPPHARKKFFFLQESFPLLKEYSFGYKSTFPHGATAAPSLPEAENIALENGGTSPGGS